MNLKLIILLITFVFSFQVLALDSTGFYKRFDLVTNSDGKVIGIKDKTLHKNFSIWMFIEVLKRQLQGEQKMMLEKGTYFQDAESILFKDSPYAQFSSEDKARTNRFQRYMMDSLHNLKDVNFDTIFDNPKFKEVLGKFDEKLKSLMQHLRLDIVAMMDNPKYFYQRANTYKAVTFALNFARKRLSSVPLLNAASDIIVKMEKLIREQRTYHQNILLYYLHNFTPEELGLTKELADQAFSSIYESRISAFTFWESNRAVANWNTYGTDYFYTYWRSANKKLRKNRNRYDAIGERLNFAFNEVTTEGREVIINLFDNESMIQWYPSIAYDHTRPNYVMRKRTLLRLVQIGMSFIPVPAFFKDLINSYVDSTYVTQRLTEGSLYAHFEAHGISPMKEAMAKQTMNPFENLELE